MMPSGRRVTRREAIQLGSAGWLAFSVSSCTAGGNRTDNRTMPDAARKTPVPPVDIARALPDLTAMARTTVRLHPRRGDQPAGGSKIGGSFVWPSNERWPVCDEHESSFVTALQLRKDDVPHVRLDRKSTRLNSSHSQISYA